MTRPSDRSRLPALVLAAAAAWAAAACGGHRVPEPGVEPEDRPDAEEPGRWYWAYVANRESDVVSRVRFGPEGASYEKSVDVGVMPDAIDAPTGVSVSPDGRHWYVTTAPGEPVGRLFKYETGSDRQVASVTLGSGPGSVALTPDGAEAWVADPGGGDDGAAALSVVRTADMEEAARLASCGDPSGSRVDRSGDRAYVACPGERLVVEVDARDRSVRRALRLTPGGAEVIPGERLRAARGGGGSGSRGDEAACGPTALEAGEGRLWVACPASGSVLEVDAGSLEVRRRLSVGAGPAAVARTPEGSLLLAANREGGSLSVVHLDRGEELARLETSRPAPSALAISDDGRYAFVSNASPGSRRSTVDVFDLTALERVAEVEVEHGAAGVAFWRSASAER